MSLLLLFATSAANAADPVVTDIRFAGNKVTRPEVMLREITLKKGRPASPAAIERSRQNIMNLGLFSSVTAKMQPHGVLLFTVKEKRFLLIYPLLSRDGSRVSPGLRMRWDNIGGRNHQFQFKYKRTDASDATSGNNESYQFSFNNPRLAGTYLALNASLNLDRNPVESLSGSTVTSRYNRDHYALGLTISRWLVQPGPSRGWRFSGGVLVQDRRYSYESGTTGLYNNEMDVALTAGLSYTNVNDHLYSRTGTEYGVNGTFGIEGFGSDFGYNRVEFYYRRYRWAGAPHHNLNFQLRLGLADGGIFSTEPFGIGGSKSLRGYDGLEGEAFLQANIEYMRPLFGYRSFRGVVFVDIGSAWARVKDIDLADLNAGVGIGLRWKIKSFVKLDLRLDVAYNADTGDTEVYAGTKNTF
jgi:outer membrane protein assembly factor BamA